MNTIHAGYILGDNGAFESQSVANQRCHQLYNSTLASIHSGIENELVRSICPSSDECWIGRVCCNGQDGNDNCGCTCTIGLSDPCWKWYDGSVTSYTNFEPGIEDPNNYGNVINGWDGQWDDQHQTAPKPYICNYYTNDTTPTPSDNPTQAPTLEKCVSNPVGRFYSNPRTDHLFCNSQTSSNLLGGCTNFAGYPSSYPLEFNPYFWVYHHMAPCRGTSANINKAIYALQKHHGSGNYDSMLVRTEQEKNNLVASGYIYHGILGYCPFQDPADGYHAPLYRLVDNNILDHFYTTNDAEKQSVESQGYSYEGLVCFVRIDTLQPTSVPTVDPTIYPTNYPTKLPTNNPTPAPTYNPTPAPTIHPTPAPTINPTASPTNNPTPSPTINPTPTPTNNPTDSPVNTTIYTNNPTVNPQNSYNPTASQTSITNTEYADSKSIGNKSADTITIVIILTVVAFCLLIVIAFCVYFKRLKEKKSKTDEVKIEHEIEMHVGDNNNDMEHVEGETVFDITQNNSNDDDIVAMINQTNDGHSTVHDSDDELINIVNETDGRGKFITKNNQNNDDDDDDNDLIGIINETHDGSDDDDLVNAVNKTPMGTPN